ncbi:hypothetical protein LQ948_05770 [Jiella sp. MQZ9-1]|uniref:Transmembrane protein n=1 Tax=Jiella flava TaxID=2816857 RepID=A0A939FW51_9HYPH|nr:hypothetical protein [Jiella flava]MBO0661959.1 hypothetical protein [Jiella flava]MCD2470714.1 hypothetical protein [Jiella flava]
MDHREHVEGEAVYDGDLPARMRPSSSDILLRGTMLFAAAITALALIAVPVIDRNTDETMVARGPDIDMMMTGSIQAQPQTYIIHRSVLEAPGSGPCTLFASGARRSGSC